MATRRSIRRHPGLLTTSLVLGAMASGLVLNGCALGRSSAIETRPEVIAILPGPPPPDVIADPGTGGPDHDGLPSARPSNPPSRAELPRGVASDDCACTLEYRVNLCVTIDGARTLPDDLTGVSFARVREGGAADTLSAAEVAGGARCFGEWRGVQRVLMLRAAAVIDSSGWFEIQTVDCCHGEAKTVDFKSAR
jgi:hypothetical protein